MLKKICGHTFFGEKLNKSSVVVDLGANHGEFSEAIQKRIGCSVYAIEPVPELFNTLPKNSKIYNMQGVIAASSGLKKLFIPEDRCATLHLLVDVPAREIEVPGYTFHEFVAMHKIESVDLLKIDIEGEEISLLEGFQADDFAKIKQCTVEFHDFLYPQLKPKVESIKNKFISEGFYCIPFSLNNGDVLFIKKSELSSFYYVWQKYFWKYVRGFFRKIKKIIRL